MGLGIQIAVCILGALIRVVSIACLRKIGDLIS